MQPPSEQERQENRIDVGWSPDVEGHAAGEPLRSDPEPEGSNSRPTEILLLDYDRELTYLEHEGKLRSGRRPTGFKR